MSADTRSDDADVLDLDPDATAEPTEPSDETFWQRYNNRLEMPTSAVISVLLHALILGGLVLVLLYALSGKDSKPVPIRILGDGGDDASGDGSPGSGRENAVANTTAPEKADFERLPNVSELPDVRKDIQSALALEDPSAVDAISPENVDRYKTLDEAVRKRLLGAPSGSPGAGTGGGKGDSGQEGAGPGGTGSDSTRARSLRWVLRFRTASGKDYLDQLRSLGATVLVPLRDDPKQMYVFTPEELGSPKPGRIVTDGEWGKLAGQIQFCDFKRESAIGVGQALGLSYVPSCFWAFFPAAVENDLSRAERAYKNKDSKDIAETVFQVSVVGGRYEFRVVEQKLKR